MTVAPPVVVQVTMYPKCLKAYLPPKTRIAKSDISDHGYETLQKREDLMAALLHGDVHRFFRHGAYQRTPQR